MPGGALFEKTAPPGPPRQKLLIKGGHSLQRERTFRQTMTAFGSFWERWLKRRLKASIPFFYATFHSIHNIQYFVAFSAVGGITSCLKGANSIYN
jgi:hypothetical protein